MIVAGIIAGSGAFVGVAHGQLPETPEVPQAPEAPQVPGAPEELEPVLDASAPSTRVACQVVAFGPAAVSSAASFATLALTIARLPAVPVPDETYSYLSLAQVPCAALPAPDTISECSADRTVDGIGDEVFAATGAGLVVVFVPVPVPSTGPAFDTAVAAEELLADHGVAVPGTPAASAYDELGCADVLEGVGGTPEPDVATSSGTAAGSPSVPPPAEVASADDGATSVAPAPERGQPSAGPAPAQPVTPPATADTVVAAPVVAAEGGDVWSPWRIVGIASGLLGLGLLWLFVDAGRRGSARSVSAHRAG